MELSPKSAAAQEPARSFMEAERMPTSSWTRPQRATICEAALFDVTGTHRCRVEDSFCRVDEAAKLVRGHGEAEVMERDEFGVAMEREGGVRGGGGETISVHSAECGPTAEASVRECTTAAELHRLRCKPGGEALAGACVLQ